MLTARSVCSGAYIGHKYVYMRSAVGRRVEIQLGIEHGLWCVMGCTVGHGVAHVVARIVRNKEGH